MQLELTDAELQEVRKISENCSESVERLHQRLEQLTWGDGLLEFRMQSAWGLLPWMKQLLELSKHVNCRLIESGIPLGPSLEAYQEWGGRQNS